MKQTPDPLQTMPHKGYTIDELRYQRALAMARSEIARMHVVDSFSATRQSIMSTVSPGGMMGRIIGSLNYIDYMVMGYQIWKKISKIMHRRRK